MKKWFKLFGALVFFAGCFMLLGSELIMTGNVISEKTGNLTSILSIIVIIGGVLVMMVRGEEGGLEEKLNQMKEIQIRRQLLSDEHRSKIFIKKFGEDLLRSYPKDKNDYEINTKTIMNNFYDNPNFEIMQGYLEWKYGKMLPIDILNNFKKWKDSKSNSLKSYILTNEYKEFRKKALKVIPKMDNAVFIGDYIPIRIYSEKDSIVYPGMKKRSVYYGLKKLEEEFKGKSRKYLDRIGRKSGEVIVADEIVNPEAIKHPRTLNKVSHIHWELENIMNKEYKFK